MAFAASPTVGEEVTFNMIPTISSSTIGVVHLKDSENAPLTVASALSSYQPSTSGSTRRCSACILSPTPFPELTPPPQVSWPFLHAFPLRGDVGLICELALGVVSFYYNRFESGAATESAVVFALTIVVYHYVALALTTITWRLSPFHPLAKFSG